jgi:hypothetical protein
MEANAAVLRGLGYEITSSWISASQPMGNSGIALTDISDIDMADAVMSFTEVPGTMTTSGGRHVEFGYGLARGKRLIIIGSQENVFHYYPGVEVYPDLNTFIARDKK